MWTSRAAYIGLVILSVILLFFFAKPYFLCIFAGLLLLAGIVFLCMRRDAARIRVAMELSHSGQKDGTLPFRFRIERPERLWATGAVLVELQIRNQMFHTIEKKCFLIPMEDDREYYEANWEVRQCGEIRFHCESIRVRDMLKLFVLPAWVFPDSSVICYPAHIEVQAQPAVHVTGISHEEGFLQNRKGNDPSEMSDIREYVPGDDIRSIHWKLSSKTDELILRQASEPSHYDVALLPDFGRQQWGRELDTEEACSVVALGVALGEQLLDQGYVFCVLIPTDGGLQIREVHDERQLRQVLSAWMGFRIQENAGNGLQFFQMQHLEDRFTRLVVLSAGRYEQDLKGLESRMGLTILNVIRGLDAVRNEESDNCIITELPVGQQSGTVYRVTC